MDHGFTWYDGVGIGVYIGGYYRNITWQNRYRYKQIRHKCNNIRGGILEGGAERLLR
jgi:hypothetical protein